MLPQIASAVPWIVEALRGTRTSTLVPAGHGLPRYDRGGGFTEARILQQAMGTPKFVRFARVKVSAGRVKLLSSKCLSGRFWLISENHNEWWLFAFAGGEEGFAVKTIGD